MPTETEVLRSMVERLEANTGPHPQGSYEVWRDAYKRDLVRIGAQTVFALEEQLATLRPCELCGQVGSHLGTCDRSMMRGGS